ncbi:Crp/Fnr family transcriptional regulator [Cesiribacter sp. SM1]|uniref:Crp/Fnr family transcriptional regulator n=1 Tax=Cesiribacter sp. SM1 TaxID=2861196 RepID=UPI001CD4F401|nr:Crp/Fnr family transcriptional regulator [Cesiribacter sp. SM1]
MNDLIDHFRQAVPLTDAEAELIAEAFKTKHLKKKEFLLQKGDVSNHMRFISEGCLRAYHLSDATTEYILQFGIEGWWINDLSSYITQTPATQFIQALEPCRLYQIHRDALDELFDRVPMLERFFRLKIQKAYVALQDRTFRRMSQTAEERYQDFRQQYRQLEQRVPQYMVASYLDITPEHLSALRKKWIDPLS